MYIYLKSNHKFSKRKMAIHVEADVYYLFFSSSSSSSFSSVNMYIKKLIIAQEIYNNMQVVGFRKTKECGRWIRVSSWTAQIPSSKSLISFPIHFHALIFFLIRLLTSSGDHGKSL